MDPSDYAILLPASVAAGMLNTIVGSGSLVTFPSLLALGYSPLVSNVTSAVGLLPGTASGTVGYRRELAVQRRRLMSLAIYSVSGGVLGAVLLLSLPTVVFERVAPVLVAVSIVLVLIQRRISPHRATLVESSIRRTALRAAVFSLGVYGGYFGAAQGVLLIAVLGVFIDADLQSLNALKNALMTLATIPSSLIFIIHSPVSPGAAVVIAVGSVIGGQLGARYGRRLRPRVLRAVIVCTGMVALAYLLYIG